MNGMPIADRHGKLADDSVRMCVVISKSMRDDLKKVCKSRPASVSRVIREYISRGLQKDLKNNE